MNLPCQEIFLAFQGEGVHMGRSAFFIRTYGCALQCSFCDAAGTWHKDWVPEEILRYTPEQLLKEIQAGPRPEFVVITGGEPTHHDLLPLTKELKAFGIQVHLETSGAYPIKGLFNWVTLSPKRSHLPLLSSVLAANEFKLIIEKPEDITGWYNTLKGYEHTGGDYIDCKPIWLHPEWSHREDPVVLGAISDAVTNGYGRFRAGWQLHKLYRCDSRDSRTRPLAPLGGDLRKGY